MNKKTLFFLAIIIIVTLVALIVVKMSFTSQNFNESPEYNTPIGQKTNLKFAWGVMCDSAIDPNSASEDGIIKKEWGNENRLTVEAYVITVSEGAIIKVDYKINGDNLVLEYGLDARYAPTSRICAHKFIYEITGLDRKDYIISLSNNNSLVQ